MKFLFQKNPHIAPMAWLATVKCESDIVNVIVGERVETYDNWFVEGAWSGEYSEGRFADAEWFCGTGACLKADKAVFASPTGMHAALYLVEGDKEVYISNSMPFIMAKTDLRLSPQYIGYDVFFNHNIMQGIYNYNCNIPVTNRGGVKLLPPDTLKMVLFRNITVSKDGTVQIDVKRKTKGFNTFEEYYERLVAAMQALASNAADLKRNFRYGIVSLISSGYDAACCSAIAKTVGGNTALTFEAKGKYSNDSGVGAAKRLGFEKIVERDAYAYLNRSDMPEIKSISCGDLGTQISFMSFEQDFEDNLVFSGENGDFVWEKEAGFQTINDDYHIVWKNSEIGLSESHLHQCYIPVPMTSFGITHWTDLYRISNSEEMQVWSVGGSYDRPIPRRILEERGLPRDSFGMKKYGAGFFYVFDWKNRLLSRMSENSRDSFMSYVEQNKTRTPIRACLRFGFANWKHYWNAIVTKAKITKLCIKIKNKDVERINGVPSPTITKYLIPWANSMVIDQYLEGMK